MKDVPRWACARLIISERCFCSTSTERHTKVACAPSATVIGLKGKSTEPAGVDLVTLPTLLRELVGHKAVQLQAIEESDSLPRPLYREITDFLAGNPTTQQIMAFKISAREDYRTKLK